jgi:predicted PurR-regulated permease PerM
MERPKLIRLILFILSVLLIIASILFYQHIISYLIVAFIIAYLLSPIINYAEIYNVSRTVSILIVYVILAVLLIIISNVVIPQLVNQSVDFFNVLTSVIEQDDPFSIHSLQIKGLSDFIRSLESKFPSIEVDNELKNLLDRDKFNSLIGQIPLFFKSIVNLIAFLIVVPVITFFVLKDERYFIRTIFSSISNRYFEFSLHLWEEIESSFGKFFRALLIETLLVAAMSIAGLLILKIPNAIILGLFCGLTNPIKYFGPFIGAIPTMLIILLGPTPDIYVFYAAIVFIIVQQVDSLILFPWLVGKSMNMHPLWVLLTVIAGGYAFGILGMIFAVPVVFLIKTVIVVSHKSLKQFEII